MPIVRSMLCGVRIKGSNGTEKTLISGARLGLAKEPATSVSPFLPQLYMYLLTTSAYADLEVGFRTTEIL